ncbi:MAG: hypothetical protein M3464_14405 [Chloroflexota bacterium]|nr:hypothetical protein [Chloroflexota bacterium]
MSRMLAFALVGILMVVAMTPAFAQDDVLSASILSGDCESGSTLAQLTSLELPIGGEVGAAEGRTAASSFTAAPIGFDQLTASNHAIEAGDSCGAIGGSINSAGALIVVLSGDEGDNGIAYLSPSAAIAGQTDVSVFLAPSTDDEEGQAGIQAELAEQAEVVAEEPLPTLEAEVTSTGYTDEERAYASQIIEYTDTMSSSLERFGGLMTNNQIGNDSWTTSVVAELVIWNAIYLELSELDPPPAYTEIHRLAVDAFALYVAAGEDIVFALDNFNVASLESATVKIEQATSLILQATELTNMLAEERGP